MPLRDMDETAEPFPPMLVCMPETHVDAVLLYVNCSLYITGCNDMLDLLVWLCVIAPSLHRKEAPTAF